MQGFTTMQKRGRDVGVTIISVLILLRTSKESSPSSTDWEAYNLCSRF